MKLTNSVIQAIVSLSLLSAADASLRGNPHGTPQEDEGRYVCRIDSLYTRREDANNSIVIKESILQLGAGTKNKNNQALFDQEWTLHTDQGEACGMGSSCKVYMQNSESQVNWCHDVGSSDEMRYDINVVIGTAIDNEEVHAFRSSESAVPFGKVWETTLAADGQEGTVDGGDSEATLRIKCQWEAGSCADIGFTYDHQGQDTMALEEEISDRSLKRKEKDKKKKKDSPDSVFYEDIPDLSLGDIGKVLDWIKAEVAQVRLPFCWRDSYGRGVGKIPTECPKGKVKIGALCYSQCPEGFKRFGFDCHSVCPKGFRNDGLFCRNAEYGRGAGFPWKFGDGFSDSGMRSRCEKKHGKGNCEKWGLIYYPKCKPGYKPFGCCICRPALPNCKALGLNNGVGLSCGKKIIIGDPRAMVCKSSMEKDAGLCYPWCKDGFNGVGPVCWSNCDSDQVNCGAACAKTSADCGMAIFNQVLAPLILAANVATLGLATPATKAADTAVDTISIGGKVVAGHSKVGKALVAAVKKLQTVDPKDLEKGATVIQRIRAARTGTKLNEIKTTVKIGSAAYGALRTFRQAFVEDFAGQTSKEIEAKLDSHFTPLTANFIKGVWADIQIEEMSEIYNWQIAGTTLAAVSIVDITGVTGVVAAYSQPVCHAIVPFPCIAEADTTGCHD